MAPIARSAVGSVRQAGVSREDVDLDIGPLRGQAWTRGQVLGADRRAGGQTALA